MSVRPSEVQESIDWLWNELPVGFGKRFNDVVRYVEQLERDLERGTNV